MKCFLSILLFIPVSLSAQQIECIDSVIISGCFYKIKDNRLSPEAFTSDDKYFSFSPDYDLESKSLFKIISDRRKGERDTIKFLSYKPTKDLSLYINASCRDQLDRAIDIKPFSGDNKLYKINGYKRRQVQISYVKIKWLHLKVKKDVACGEGFDRPASLFCDLSQDRFFDIYIPLELLEMNNTIQLKNGRIVFPSH